MIKRKIYDEDEYRMYRDLDSYYPGITTECFKDWEEMSAMVNTIYGYPIMNKNTRDMVKGMSMQEHLDGIAKRTIKLEALKNAMVERWVNENIEHLIGERQDGIRCDIDMELENIVFNIVDGNITEPCCFKSRFAVGLVCSIPQILIDFFKNR